MAEKILYFWKRSQISVYSLHFLTLCIRSNSSESQVLQLTSHLHLCELWLLPWIEHLLSPKAFDIRYIDTKIIIPLSLSAFEITVHSMIIPNG